jgi:hypothetical protein
VRRGSGPVLFGVVARDVHQKVPVEWARIRAGRCSGPFWKGRRRGLEAASVRAHSILSYAPTNLIIAATRTRRGMRRGIPSMLLAAPYLPAAHWCVTTIENGGPGWLNLLVLLRAWNSIKLILNGPITVVLIIRTKIRERARPNVWLVSPHR